MPRKKDTSYDSACDLVGNTIVVLEHLSRDLRKSQNPTSEIQQIIQRCKETSTELIKLIEFGDFTNKNNQ